MNNVIQLKKFQNQNAYNYDLENLQAGVASKATVTELDHMVIDDVLLKRLKGDRDVLNSAKNNSDLNKTKNQISNDFLSSMEQYVCNVYQKAIQFHVNDLPSELGRVEWQANKLFQRFLLLNSEWNAQKLMPIHFHRTTGQLIQGLCYLTLYILVLSAFVIFSLERVEALVFQYSDPPFIIKLLATLFFAIITIPIFHVYLKPELMSTKAEDRKIARDREMRVILFCLIAFMGFGCCSGYNSIIEHELTTLDAQSKQLLRDGVDNTHLLTEIADFNKTQGYIIGISQLCCIVGELLLSLLFLARWYPILLPEGTDLRKDKQDVLRLEEECKNTHTELEKLNIKIVEYKLYLSQYKTFKKKASTALVNQLEQISPQLTI
ncbi:MAG: hypothetical protein HQK65_16265 [Desulfamplus sp.]|nr:hypothetical protein [Desulfamplus sp.]